MLVSACHIAHWDQVDVAHEAETPQQGSKLLSLHRGAQRRISVHLRMPEWLCSPKTRTSHCCLRCGMHAVAHSAHQLCVPSRPLTCSGRLLVPLMSVYSNVTRRPAARKHSSCASAHNHKSFPFGNRPTMHLTRLTSCSYCDHNNCSGTNKGVLPAVVSCACRVTPQTQPGAAQSPRTCCSEVAGAVLHESLQGVSLGAGYDGLPQRLQGAPPS